MRNDMTEGQLPPHDLDLERTVLSSMASRPSNVGEVAELLTPDSFYDPRHGEIYRAALAVYNSGEMPDIIRISHRLMTDGSTMGPADVAQICGHMPVTDVGSLALILRDYSLRRRMWEMAVRLRSMTADLSQPIESIHGEAKETLDGLFEATVEKDITLRQAYNQLQERMLLNQQRDPSAPYGTPTGFEELDRNGGLNPSDLIVVGAETSQGKTSFATALTISAMEHGESVAFYSMEMSPEQIAARIGSMKTGVPVKDLLYDALDTRSILQVDAAIESIGPDRMHFDDRSSSSLDSIMMSIRGMKARHGISGAVVDYLQLVNVTDRRLNREQQMSRAARELKNLAKELGIWIIAISQLNRNPQNPIPSLSRLRDSGEIEQAADNVFLIYRPRDNTRYPEPFSDIPTQGTAMVKVAKGRNIGTAEFICGFNGETTTFYPLDEAELKRMKYDLPRFADNKITFD